MEKRSVKLGTIYDKASGPKYDCIVEWIGSGKKILDIGCGSGNLSVRIKKNGNQVVGVELSDENYRNAQKMIKVYFGDFLKTEIRESFDIVLFADVLEHMYHPDHALKKACKLSKEIILCVPNFDFWGVRILRRLGIKKMKSGILDENHVYYFNKNIIEMMIKCNGLEIIDFASPSPKKIPKFYNHIVKMNYNIFGYQYIYRCKVNDI